MNVEWRRTRGSSEATAGDASRNSSWQRETAYQRKKGRLRRPLSNHCCTPQQHHLVSGVLSRLSTTVGAYARQASHCNEAAGRAEWQGAVAAERHERGGERASALRAGGGCHWWKMVV